MAKSADKAYGGESRGASTIMFDVEKLHVITDEKHTLYDERVNLPLKEEVVVSIMEHGVRVPIVVWKNRDDGTVIVLDGKQRRANALEANKRLKKEGRPARQIRGIVFEGTIKAALAEMIILNEGRQDSVPSNRARSAERLLEAGYTETEVGTILHLKPGTLRNYRAILECAPAVRAAVDDGRLPPTMAYGMAKLEPAEQKERLAKMLEAAKGVVGPRQRNKKMREAVGVLKRRSPKEIREMIKTITERFGERAQTTIDLLEWVLGAEPPGLIPSTPSVALDDVEPPESEEETGGPSGEPEAATGS